MAVTKIGWGHGDGDACLGRGTQRHEAWDVGMRVQGDVVHRDVYLGQTTWGHDAWDVGMRVWWKVGRGDVQSGTQSLQAFLSAVGHLERRRDNGMNMH